MNIIDIELDDEEAMIPYKSNEFWFVIKIQSPVEDGVDLKKVWRKLKNGSNSIGMSNKNFMDKWIQQGFWVNYEANEENTMMIFFSTLKNDITKFYRRFQMRYYAIARKKPIFEMINIPKLNNENELYAELKQLMEKQLNAEYDNGHIPTKVKASAFGKLYNIKKKKKQKELQDLSDIEFKEILDIAYDQALKLDEEVENDGC